MAQVKGTQEPDVARKIGRASCEYGVTGVYFSSDYDTGELRIVEYAPRQVAAELAGLEGGAPQFRERIFGWMPRTLDLAGARDLRAARSTCVHGGDRVCRFEGSWD